MAQHEGKVMDSLESEMREAEAVTYLAPKCTRCGKGAADITKDAAGEPACSRCTTEASRPGSGLPGLVEAYNRCRKAT